MSAEVRQCYPLLYHVLIMPIDSQTQLDQVVFRNEVPNARTEGLAQAVEEFSDSGDVFILCVALAEECMSEGPLCLPAGEDDLAIAGSHFSWGRRF